MVPDRAVRAMSASTLSLEGPANVWYAAGFGSKGSHRADDPSIGMTMTGTNWTVVVLGNSGAVQERNLGNHEPGTLLAPVFALLGTRWRIRGGYKSFPCH